METNWNTAIAFVLEAEGGLTNDPNDSGGLTNRGLTHTDIEQWNVKHAQKLDIRLLTIEQARLVYRQKYWITCGAGKLPSGVDVVHFDTAVNLGLSQAQTCLNRTHKPGFSPRATCFAYLADRSAVYDKIVAAHPQDEVFRKGWQNRLEALKALVERLCPHVQV